MERRYLAWLDRIEAQQARGAAKLAAWDRKHPGVIDNLNCPDKVRTLFDRLRRLYPNEKS
jgi:hypothetical protein